MTARVVRRVELSSYTQMTGGVCDALVHRIYDFVRIELNN